VLVVQSPDATRVSVQYSSVHIPSVMPSLQDLTTQLYRQGFITNAQGLTLKNMIRMGSDRLSRCYKEGGGAEAVKVAIMNCRRCSGYSNNGTRVL
jgi:hypothetical protein